MIRTIIESPLAGRGDTDIERNADMQRNLHYARLCLIDCIDRGETPYASHLLLTQIWDDLDEKLRERGIKAGHAWYAGAERCAVYQDLGRSSGMNRGIVAACAVNVPVFFRRLPRSLLSYLDGSGYEPTEGALTW